MKRSVGASATERSYVRADSRCANDGAHYAKAHDIFLLSVPPRRQNSLDHCLSECPVGALVVTRSLRAQPTTPATQQPLPNPPQTTTPRLMRLPDETLVFPAHDYKGDTSAPSARKGASTPAFRCATPTNTPG